MTVIRGPADYVKDGLPRLRRVQEEMMNWGKPVMVLEDFLNSSRKIMI